MRELGLVDYAFVAVALVAGCQTSEPAQANPPSSATGVPTSPVAAPAARAPAGEARVYDQKTELVEVRANGRFTIALEANVTTPLEWKLEPDADPALLGAEGRKYTDAPPPGCPGCTGYGGTDAFTFVAKAPGETTLHFAYRELKPGAPPAKELKIRIKISN